MTELQDGKVLAARYELTARLAAGGMGEVWRGQDLSLGREVAIKVLKESAQHNETFLRRFQNEAKNAAGLVHPNIAQVFDYGFHDHIAYLVMEFVDGEPMSTILEREKTIREHRLVNLLRQTCLGLSVAHAAGVIHRDIKPGNLLVQADDALKISDFGVSRSTDQTTLTATGMVMGTAQYLAPELALGKPATPVSDLYALGIIAYESVVGRRPFTAATPVDIAIAQVNDEVPPLPRYVSPTLAALIMRLLEKNPRKRPQSALELAKLLDELQLRQDSADEPPLGENLDNISAIPGSRRYGKMPPSIAPRVYRPRPDVPNKRQWKS